MANKFHNHSIWIVPGNTHKFRSEHDAKYYCQQHGIDFSLVEKYDSDKEHQRWLELQDMEKDGLISELQRQVKYELVPDQYEHIPVKEKTVTDYFVEIGSRHAYFTSMKAAREFCKVHNYGYDRITKHDRTKTVYKKILAERRIIYTADFVYNENGKTIVEDVKSEITRKERDYIIVRKLMRYLLRINIREIL